MLRFYRTLSHQHYEDVRELFFSVLTIEEMKRVMHVRSGILVENTNKAQNFR